MTDISGLPASMTRRIAGPPSRLSALVFAFKTNVFRLQRFAGETGRAPARLNKAEPSAFPHVVAESRTQLWSDQRLAERQMQLGKVQNLRIAARALDGTHIPASAVFSFWRQLGRPARARGFVDGRMLQEGCMVPAVAGGLCQLSNALYDVALQAGCEIVERHAHSRIVPGSAARHGRDATIAWNYVDLRFRNAHELLLRVFLAHDELVVRLLGREEISLRDMAGGSTTPAPVAHANNCGTCGETSCFRHERNHAPALRKTAFLLDELWPEFEKFVAGEKQSSDVLGIPLDGARWDIARYRWDTSGFAKAHAATTATLLRSFASRRLAAQGPGRQIAQLRGAEALAARLAKSLTPDITDVCVAQSLLPFLWREGHLAARHVTVLMTRLPIRALQSKLDSYAALHPERLTLSDFRAPPDVTEWETAALANADTIVTPHAEVASLFDDRAIKLEWCRSKLVRGSHSAPRRRIAFPGPTVARKGCFELRDAARALDIEIVPLGSEIEGNDFWSGVRTGRPHPANWLEGIDVAVQPAFVENAPRKLLAALEAGVPVIATAACGLDPQPRLTLVPEGDANALSRAIERVLG